MDKAIRILVGLIILTFFSYVVYRNIRLHSIPSKDLVKDESTNKLYKMVQPNTDNLEWINYYYTKDSVLADDLDSDIKYNIAFKNTGMSSSKITEETLKIAYEYVFGKDSYKQVDTFYGGCNLYKYSKEEESYLNENRKNCDTKKIEIVSKITDAREKDGYFTLDVIIAYMDTINKVVYKSCNKDMSKCTDKLADNYTAFDEADLDNYKNKLNKFKFTYKENNQEYYFYKVEKVK